jgi:hypothetical protein
MRAVLDILGVGSADLGWNMCGMKIGGFVGVLGYLMYLLAGVATTERQMLNLGYYVCFQRQSYDDSQFEKHPIRKGS